MRIADCGLEVGDHLVWIAEVTDPGGGVGCQAGAEGFVAQQAFDGGGEGLDVCGGIEQAVSFVLDDLARVGSAYWGGYGLAQQAQVGMVGMLQSELASSKIRVSGLQPGPMRTPLRAKAYVEENDRVAGDPEVYAVSCVTLLSPAGAAHRGKVWAPSP